MAVPSLAYHVDLCSGSGMLGLAVKLALAGRLRTLAYVEREAHAAATLVARMADAALDNAPVWDDVKSLTDPEFLGLVQGFRPLVVTAGYPCQPFSVAGKRLGVNDERHLWPYIDAFIGTAKPECVFLENVPGHLRMGFGQVRRDLEGRGYRVAAGLFSASEVGASHRRERLFILALEHAGRQLRPQLELQPEGQAREPTGPGAGMAQPANGGCGIVRQSSGCGGQPDGRGADVADADVLRRRAQGHAEFAPEEPDFGNDEVAHAAGECKRKSDHDARRGGGARPAREAAVGGGRNVGDTARRQGHGGKFRAMDQATGGGYGIDAATCDAGGVMADAAMCGGGPCGTAEGYGRQHAWPCGISRFVADAGLQGFQGRQQPGTHEGRNGQEASGSIAELCLPLFAPGPAALDAWVEILALDPALEPAICRTPDGVAPGMVADRLRLTGNGVVPLAAAYAFVSLFAALCEL